MGVKRTMTTSLSEISLAAVEDEAFAIAKDIRSDSKSTSMCGCNCHHHYHYHYNTNSLEFGAIITHYLEFRNICTEFNKVLADFARELRIVNLHVEADEMDNVCEAIRDVERAIDSRAENEALTKPWHHMKAKISSLGKDLFDPSSKLRKNIDKSVSTIKVGVDLITLISKFGLS